MTVQARRTDKVCVPQSALGRCTRLRAAWCATKSDMGLGDRISPFIRRLAAGDRAVAVLCAKYLRPTLCFGGVRVIVTLKDLTHYWFD